MKDEKAINRPLKGLKHINRHHLQKGVITPVEPAIQFPKDMYLHAPIKSTTNPDGCPTEWWWHIGTLQDDASGRLFGFEINAAGMYPGLFTEVMLTDIEDQVHYHETKATVALGDSWAESDPTKPWKVSLEKVTMSAPQTDPTKDMLVTATLEDDGTTVEFSLNLSQEGVPLYVWGTGVSAEPTPPKVATNNYYFSLTRMTATGTITITPKGKKAEVYNVSGTTWMDHEWGMFSNHGSAVTWILQDMQLHNGTCISNFSMENPELNKTTSGKATVQCGADGISAFVETTLKPTKQWTDAKGKVFFTEVEVAIPDYEAKFTVTSFMDDQVFTSGGVYEGVAGVSGEMNDGSGLKGVIGTAWMEQTI